MDDAVFAAGGHQRAIRTDAQSVQVIGTAAAEVANVAAVVYIPHLDLIVAADGDEFRLFADESKRVNCLPPIGMVMVRDCSPFSNPKS